MPENQDADGVHRLDDMIVEEVSLVDRAANKRRFLTVKRLEKTDMPTGAAIVTNPDGSATAAPAPPPAVAAPASTEKAAIELTADAKKLLGDAIDTAMKSLTDAAKQVKGAKEIEPDPETGAAPEMPDDLVEQIMGAAETLEDACMAAMGYDAGAEEPAEAPPPDGATPPPPDPATAPGAMAMGKSSPSESFEVMKAQRVVAKSILRKRGARMSKERLSRFQEAFGLLSNIINEVSPMLAKAGKAKKTPPPPPAPAAGAKAPPFPAKKSAEDRIAELEKAVAAGNTKIATLEKRAPSSNAIPVQDQRTKTEKSDDDVRWPLDMNSPVPEAGDRF